MKLDPLSSVIGSTLWRWRQKPKNIQVLLNFLISVEEAAVEVRVKELKCNSSQGLFLCPEKGEHPLDSGLSGNSTFRSDFSPSLSPRDPVDNKNCRDISSELGPSVWNLGVFDWRQAGADLQMFLGNHSSLDGPEVNNQVIV